MSKILIGPAGTGGSGIEGFERVKKAGLDAVEIEFVYSIWLNKQQAEKIAKENKKLKLVLSIHAPYYINLNSKEKQKISASRSRILKSCEIGHYIGAEYIIFHPGFYQGASQEETYKNIKEQILKMQAEIKQKKLKVQLALETTGKPSQFGSLDELIKLKKETGCHICIDFAHLKARSNGKMNYEEMAEKIAAAKLGHIPCHFSGVEFTDKGERRHLLTPESEIKLLLTALKKHKIDCTIINESPNPLEDSIKTKRILNSLG